MRSSEGRIDPASKAALEELLLRFPRGVNSISDLSDRRAALNSMTRKINKIEHLDVEVLNLYVPSADKNRIIALRTYRDKKKSLYKHKPCLIYIHGGGMIMGDLDTGNLICLSLARKFDLFVISIDYRKAPDSPYPAAISDCKDGISWIIENAEILKIDMANMGIYGSSAGGGLVLGTVLKLRDDGRSIFKYMLPIYPMIDDSNSTTSSREITNVGIWDRSANIEAWGWYLSGAQPDKYAAPARAEDLTGLPPCYSDVGEFDLFRDENLIFFDRLGKSGVPVEFKVFPGAFHGSENLAPDSELSKTIWANRFKAIERFIEG